MYSNLETALGHASARWAEHDAGSGLNPDDLGALMSVDGVVNGDVFAAYLDQVLGPTLVPGDVVVPDNLPARKVAGLAEPVAAH